MQFHVLHNAGTFFMIFVKTVFKIKTIFNKFFEEVVTIRVSNSLEPDQDRCSIGPDLDPNCLQRLSAEDKCHS